MQTTTADKADGSSFGALMLRLRDGSHGAAGEIFGRMRSRLLGLVRERLDHSPLRGRIDPEDLVQSVLGTFWKRYRRGEWTPSGFQEWDDLWNLLAKIARHRITRRHRAAFADKRGGGAVEVPLVSEDGSVLEQAGGEPAPFDVVVCAETLEVLLSQLEESCQTTVLLALEGHSKLEIAELHKVSLRTVNRRLELARKILESLIDGGEPARPSDSE